ncbi:MAG TPA: lipoyl(octanoyl) transferase LipB [Candidatus Dormibacteraeota bacterium]|nr:lipoyl(octanoyl) transferase LipB [Candidatus Dormibacteraeota bacterium]
MNVYDLGVIDYVESWRLQEALATRVRGGEADALLLLEHPHVYTIGRRGTVDHITAPLAELRRLGASVYQVDRGGDVTYHGPGQLVAYPIVDLARRGGDVVAFVRALEDAIIGVAAGFGVAARRVEGRTGVWVTLPAGPPAKLAAIGVRVARGVTTHGLALNVTTGLEWFERMVPCGFPHAVASLERLGVRTSVDAVKPMLASALADALGVELSEGGAPAPARDDEIRADASVRAAVDLLREAIPA